MKVNDKVKYLGKEFSVLDITESSALIANEEHRFYVNQSELTMVEEEKKPAKKSVKK